MKKMMFTIMALFVAVNICAQQSQTKLTRKQKKKVKIANELDVLKYLPSNSDGKQITFWQAIVDNNDDFKTIMSKFDNPSGLAKQALEKTQEKTTLIMSMNMSYDSNIEGEFNEILHEEMFGDKTYYPNITFRLLINNEFNAFTTPDGFIYLNSGVIDKTKPKIMMVYAVLAHEVAHYLLKHALIHEYMALKKERANNIAAALATIGLGVANIAAASGGAIVDSETQKKSYDGIVEGAKEWSEAYYYRYGREEELIADIVAYRFLEWIGVDPDIYLTTLEKVTGGWVGRETDRYDDHPSAIDRIEILKALTPAPYRIKIE